MQVLQLQGIDAPSATKPTTGSGSSSISIICCLGA
jgi:hypothetical protein